MKVIAVIFALVAATNAGVIAPTTLLRTPSLDSAVIKSDRLGGNFAYSSVEGHAYAAVSPVVQNVVSPVAVSYSATPIAAPISYYSHGLVAPQTILAPGVIYATAPQLIAAGQPAIISPVAPGIFAPNLITAPNHQLIVPGVIPIENAEKPADGEAPAAEPEPAAPEAETVVAAAEPDSEPAPEPEQPLSDDTDSVSVDSA